MTSWSRKYHSLTTPSTTFWDIATYVHSNYPERAHFAWRFAGPLRFGSNFPIICKMTSWSRKYHSLTTPSTTFWDIATYVHSKYPQPAFDNGAYMGPKWVAQTVHLGPMWAAHMWSLGNVMGKQLLWTSNRVGRDFFAITFECVASQERNFGNGRFRPRPNFYY